MQHSIDKSLYIVRNIVSRQRNFSLEKLIFSFLFLLLIFESGKKNFSFYSRFLRVWKFSFVLGTPGSCNNGVFGWKRKSFNLVIQVHLFWKFLFLFSKNMSSWFLCPLSKHEIRISNFSFYSRIRNKNFKFLFLLSKLEIRISNFTFYSWFYFWGSRQCLAGISKM